MQANCRREENDEDGVVEGKTEIISIEVGVAAGREFGVDKRRV